MTSETDGGELVAAAGAGKRARVVALLRRGTDPDARDADGTTALYAAAVQGHAPIVRLLLAAGARPDTESRGPGSDGTPLCAASAWGHSAVVRELLAHCADPALREDGGQGMSPLEWAERGGHEETARLLRAAGA